MIKVMFVCHGNICRSPMAEFVLKDMCKKRGYSDDFFITSSATSCEELGNPVHYSTRKTLNSAGIICENKTAVRLKKEDYKNFDYIIAMDSQNICNIMNIIGSDPDAKVYKLLEFCGRGDVADPWYTGDFDKTFEDISCGCSAFLETVCLKKGLI